MGNQSQDNKPNAETKKPTNQPSYGDKPWQAPQYGQAKNDSQKDASHGESCGCDSDKQNKKDQNSIKNR